jgi:hypothetical protein
MKKTFEKKDNTEIIIIMVAAAVTAGTVAYLYFTEKGHETRKSLKHKMKDEAKIWLPASSVKRPVSLKKPLKKWLTIFLNKPANQNYAGNCRRFNPPQFLASFSPLIF